jgi:hypothetical protein
MYLEVWHLEVVVRTCCMSHFGGMSSMTSSRLSGVWYAVVSTSSRLMAGVCVLVSP